jgi:hypothetical protein
VRAKRDDAAFIADDGSLDHAIAYAEQFVEQFRIKDLGPGAPPMYSQPDRKDAGQALLILTTIVHRWSTAKDESPKPDVVYIKKRKP